MLLRALSDYARRDRRVRGCILTQRLRFLLDTNILIPLQDSMLVLTANLANFVRLANVGGHQLLYHPASIDDINRDTDVQRRSRTRQRLSMYTRLEETQPSPRNTLQTKPNDVCDNDILYALECAAAHALVTEDKDIHVKARHLGLADRVYNIQTAEDWLRRLHEPTEVNLPNIEDVALHTLTHTLGSSLYDSLRMNYEGQKFDGWFLEKAREGRHAWISRNEAGSVDAICVYDVQTDQIINNENECLKGLALKLCTFKVGEAIRGRKIGELFLKAAFRYATENKCENIFVHTNPEQNYLIELLADFGFEERGRYRNDVMLVKPHPTIAPVRDLPALEYAKKYFPHFRHDADVSKFLIPIKPEYHNILFPDISRQGQLFGASQVAGNAIKQAYLCRAQTNQVQEGDIVLFYRTGDDKAITTLGVVERYQVHSDATDIMQLVSRRTVYSREEIEVMARRPTKVMLFRLAKHFSNPVSYDNLRKERIVLGPIQSITKISDDAFSKLLGLTER